MIPKRRKIHLCDERGEEEHDEHAADFRGDDQTSKPLPPASEAVPAVEGRHAVADNVRETTDDHGGEVEDGHSRLSCW